MKRFFLTTAFLLSFISTIVFALPDFWYSSVAYNSMGQIVTTSPLASVEVRVSDGVNSLTQTFTNVPVNGFGVFTVHVDAPGLGAVNMVAGTNIILKVNGITVVGAPLSSTYIFNNILPAGGSTTDQTIDAWVNNLPQNRVELGTLSDGTTSRPLGTEFVILDNGKVGIGTSSPSSQLQINSTGTGVYSSSTGGMALWGISGVISGAGVLGDNTTGEAVVGRSSGGIGVGAVVGRSDGAGYGVRGFNTSTGVAGRFENQNAANTSNATEIENNGLGKGLQINITNASNTSRGIDVNHSGTGTGVFSNSSGSHGVWGISGVISGAGVLGDNSTGEAVVGRSSGGVGVGAVVGRSDGAGYGVRGFNTSTGVAGRFESQNAANTSNATEIENNGLGKGLQINLTNASNNSKGIDVNHSGSGTGVFSSSAGSNGLWGISGIISGAGVLGDNSTGEAVVGRSSGGVGVGAVVGRSDGAGYGVRGFNTTSTGVAGRFENQNAANTSDALQVVTNGTGNAARFTGNVVITGNLNVSGTVAKGGGSFVIDHPLDPLNKKLYHSFVESPDMKNIYDGNVKLNEFGGAVITLPDWFSAVNGDFRYQLTAIGGPGAGLYIAEEISNNQFKIAGGTAGLKVSWQVTGIRKDAWAEKNRIQVEVNKVGEEKGQYMHPDAYGVSPEKNSNFNSIQMSNSNLPSNQINNEKRTEQVKIESNLQNTPLEIPSNQKFNDDSIKQSNKTKNLLNNVPQEIPSNQMINESQNKEK